MPLSTPDLFATVEPYWVRGSVEIPEYDPEDARAVVASDPALARMLESFPLHEGSRWTYRVRMRDDRVWASAITTHTVQALAPAPNGDGLIAYLEETMRLKDVPLVQTWPSVESLARARGRWRIRITADGLLDMNPLDAPSQILGSTEPLDNLFQAWRVLWSEDVVVPAGTYQDCQLIQWRPGNTGGTHRWFCEGIGFVKEELCTSSNPSMSIIKELMEYEP